MNFVMRHEPPPASGAGDIKLLRVALAGDTLVFEVSDDPAEPQRIPIEPLRRRVDDIKRHWQNQWQGGEANVVAIAGWFAQDALTEEMRKHLRAWALYSTGPKLLIVAAAWDDPTLQWMPWETLPLALGCPNLLVVRGRPESPAQAPVSADLRRTVLAIGWSEHRGLMLEGIAREIKRLPDVLRGLETRSLLDPTPEALAQASQDRSFLAVHVAAVAFDEEKLAAVAAAARRTVRPPALVLLNTCHSGGATAWSLCHEFGATVVGWPGWIDDAKAVDFALYFYSRLGEGETVVGAIRAFLDQTVRQMAARVVAQPIVWFSRKADATARLFPARVPVTDARVRGSDDSTDSYVHTVGSRGILPDEPWTQPSDDSADANVRAVLSGGIPLGESLPDLGRLGRSGLDILLRPGVAADRTGAGGPPATSKVGCRIELKLEQYLCPGLLKNGWPPIRHLTLDSTGQQDNVLIHIECDTGRGKSHYRETRDLKKGPQAINTGEIRLPAIEDLFDQDCTRRYVSISASATRADGRILAETTRTAQWLQRNEWIDQPDTWPFLPAFVQPNSDGVLTVIDRALTVLRNVGAPSDKFDGYATNNRAGVSVQVNALYQTLRDEPFELRYISPPPVPLYDRDRRHIGQAIRFPSEIIERRRGTCLDLALLFAALTEHIGLDPLVILLPDHAFFAYWQSHEFFEQFWLKEQAEPPAERTRRCPWLITDPRKLKQLVDEHQIEPLEVTRVTNPESTYEQARLQGLARINNLEGTDQWDRPRFHVAVDVCAARHKVQPV